ncbi:NAD(+)/NADH kinase [Halobaculum sp. MBLA0147]|uniref:NAD(+)/NADH kinase n=1 Tax=Halobaculum sp. MBLA0147 TaxID=3079934 RepID=UPI0035251B59
MYVGIVAQRGNERAASLAGQLRRQLRSKSVRVAVDEATAAALAVDGTPVDEFDATDLVVSIGGDGTFLYAAHGAGGTPILGVNLGEVGFLNAVAPADAVDAVSEEVRSFEADADAATADGVREVPRIAATCDGWTSRPAVNEIVVQGQRRGHGGGADLTVSVDGAEYTTGHADGVLIATPTGSTAYNLSERGPLVHPSVDALVVNEMAAADGMPPLVVGPDATVDVRIEAPPARGAGTESDGSGEGPSDEGDGAATGVVVSDGRDTHQVEVPTTVSVETTTPPVRIAGPTADFFQALGKLA